ncbi:acetyl-CoA carboxylase biotin carboxyl carrier protein [Ectobacillus polymachus]|uniref:acetyl-CoA carboxylase biotin carboxyl carrier protein n=1 Tax=Ectobacillus polymachus TaxID=1508806 RepID=UPI003A84C711
MFKIQEVRELIKLIDSSNIDEFEYKADGSTIKLKKQNNNVVTYEAAPVVETRVVSEPKVVAAPAPVAVAAPEVQAEVKETAKVAEDETLLKITSPMVGTFYSAPSPETPAYVKVGDRVSDDSVVCIVEAMKLFNEIEAEVSGEIVEILVKNGQLVEYGQPLFLVRP